MINEILFKAVKTGKVDEVEKALTEEKINTATYFGAKSIVLAAELGNREILEMLLKNGEKINRESFWRRTAFSSLRAAKNAGNTEILELLLEYGAGVDKKRLDSALANETHKKTNTTKFCYEDGIYIPKKQSKLAIIDDALEKNNWRLATTLLESSIDSDVDFYTECLKKMFLKATYISDTDKVKFYLEKLIENAVGVLTDETGKSTLEIAIENSPADIIKILSNYGFQENALRHAYKCLINN